jgi:hypothetical protein
MQQMQQYPNRVHCLVIVGSQPHVVGMLLGLGLSRAVEVSQSMC